MTQVAEQGSYEPFDAKAWKVGIVVADFNRNITDQLYQSAVTRAKEYGLTDNRITSIHVAGSVEIPLVLQQLAETNHYDALLAIGCVVRGETAHFDYVCKFVTEGVLRVQLDKRLPIGFGVLMCETFKQAEARADLGAEHLDAVMHQARAIKNLQDS